MLRQVHSSGVPPFAVLAHGSSGPLASTGRLAPFFYAETMKQTGVLITVTSLVAALTIQAADFGSLATSSQFPSLRSSGATIDGIPLISSPTNESPVDISTQSAAFLDSTLRDLVTSGAAPPDSALFSFMFVVSNDCPAIKNADMLGWPDVFTILEVEGKGTYLIPDIRGEYSGGPILQTFVGGFAAPGMRIAIYILDDDTLSNEIWNSILSQKIDWKVKASYGEAISAFFRKKDGEGMIDIKGAMQVEADASGSFQLLKTKQVLDAPDRLAWAVIRVPETGEGRWSATTELRDKDGNIVGRMELRSLSVFTKKDLELHQQGQQKAKLLEWGIYIVGAIASMFIVLAFLHYRTRRQQEVP